VQPGQVVNTHVQAV